VSVRVGVSVGLAVIVLVGVFVIVGVFVLVAVRVGVRVMVEVAVFVGVLVGVGLDRTENNSSGSTFTEDCRLTRFTFLPVIIPPPPEVVTLVESVAARAGIAGQARAIEIAIPATDWTILRNILILPIILVYRIVKPR